VQGLAAGVPRLPAGVEHGLVGAGVQVHQVGHAAAQLVGLIGQVAGPR
jgi:hypothetical protein